MTRFTSSDIGMKNISKDKKIIQGCGTTASERERQERERKEMIKKTRTLPVRTQNQIWNLRQRLDLSLLRIFPIYQEWIKPFLVGAAIDISDLKTKSPTYQT